MNMDAYRLAALLALFTSACGGAQLAGDVGDDVESESSSAATARTGGKAKVTAQSGLHLRRAPNTGAAIILTMPHGSEVDVLAQSGGWFSVRYHGTIGWAHGGYLEAVHGGGQPAPHPAPPAPSSPPAHHPGTPVGDAIARAESGLGFSYHWGGGCWQPGSSAHGACYGNCPNCSHSGTWGADCSGYVSKIWQVPGSEALTHCSHPYSTNEFHNTQAHWRAVPRSQARLGDAFVHHSGGAGHIFVYGGGDAWGSIRAYEAKGCHFGIQRNMRGADSSYKVIRRNGY